MNNKQIKGIMLSNLEAFVILVYCCISHIIHSAYYEFYSKSSIINFINVFLVIYCVYLFVNGIGTAFAKGTGIYRIIIALSTLLALMGKAGLEKRESSTWHSYQFLIASFIIITIVQAILMKNKKPETCS